MKKDELKVRVLAAYFGLEAVLYFISLTAYLYFLTLAERELELASSFFTLSNTGILVSFGNVVLVSFFVLAFVNAYTALGILKRKQWAFELAALAAAANIISVIDLSFSGALNALVSLLIFLLIWDVMKKDFRNRWFRGIRT